MNSPDPLEERVARTLFRQAPASLREQVLQAARQTVPEPACSFSLGAQASACLGRLKPALLKLWPHPLAWGTLGLAWLMILILNLAVLRAPASVTTERTQTHVSPAWTAALRAQRALLQSLLQDPPSVATSLESGPGAQLWPADNRFGSLLV